MVFCWFHKDEPLSHSVSLTEWLGGSSLINERIRQVLLILSLVNRALIGNLQAWLRFSKYLICDQTLVCSVLQKRRRVSGQFTLVLQVSQPGRHVENGRSVHGNAGLIEKRESPAFAFSGFLLSANIVCFSIKMAKVLKNKWQEKSCLTSYGTFLYCCTASKNGCCDAVCGGRGVHRVFVPVTRRGNFFKF